MKIETNGKQHSFEVQVYLNELDPKPVQVELYTDGPKNLMVKLTPSYM